MQMAFSANSRRTLKGRNKQQFTKYRIILLFFVCVCVFYHGEWRGVRKWINKGNFPRHITSGANKHNIIIKKLLSNYIFQKRKPP